MNIDWSKAPEDATHKDRFDECFYKMVGDVWHQVFGDGKSLVSSSLYNCERNQKDLIERPKKQEAWNGEGLPPVGLDVLAKVDFKKAPPYTIINLTEIGIDVQNSMPSFQKVKVLYASEKYVILLAIGVECMAPRSCVEFEKIKTAEQLAEEERKSQIEVMHKIYMEGASEHKGGLAALYDAGYKLAK